MQCVRMDGSTLWNPDRDLHMEGGGRSICPLFPSALGLPSKMTTTFVTVDPNAMKLTWPCWVAIMATLFWKVQRWHWSQVAVWTLGRPTLVELPDNSSPPPQSKQINKNSSI